MKFSKKSHPAFRGYLTIISVTIIKYLAQNTFQLDSLFEKMYITLHILNQEMNTTLYLHRFPTHKNI